MQLIYSRIRKKTWTRLHKLKNGVLSRVLEKLLEKDPLSPLLTKLHYEALDRRLKHIIETIENCILNHGPEYTIVNDELQYL